MKKYFLFLFFCISYAGLHVSATTLPIREWKSKQHDKPLLFYITGDGGLNDFSVSFCRSLNESGYDVTALNARSYFWDKKTPAGTAQDIAGYITQTLKGRSNQEVVLIGYSFGADVLPFVVNKMGDSIKIRRVFLMGPSPSTDFEIHWSDIFGGNKKRDMDVVAEINRMSSHDPVILTGSDEKIFPFRDITLKKYTHEVLPGGHHFDRDVDQVKSVIFKHL
jgi:type IV secretory pathway VirJ component